MVAAAAKEKKDRERIDATPLKALDCSENLVGQESALMSLDSSPVCPPRPSPKRKNPPAADGCDSKATLRIPLLDVTDRQSSFFGGQGKKQRTGTDLISTATRSNM